MSLLLLFNFFFLLFFNNIIPGYIEIIIPGSKYYSFYNLIYKNEDYLWSEENLFHLHKNMENKLGISIIFPGMQQLIEKYIHDPLNEKFLKYQSCNDQNTSYYIFNWPGKKSNEHRRRAALRLYYDIKKLKKLYPEKKIIILAHSHGGNMALEMADWVNVLQDNLFFIDELYLFGTPIGNKTEKWAIKKNINNRYIFKKIINFYHEKDLFQIADIFFDIKCKRKLKCQRAYLYNEKSSFQISDKSIFNKLYWYHTHFFTIDFLCNQFLDIKRKMQNIIV